MVRSLRIALSFAVLLLLLQSCKNGFSVKGTIEHMPEQKFRVEELATDKNIPIDSGRTKADGSFEIEASATEESLYRIRFEQGKYILLALKNGDKAKVNADWNQLEDYRVEGSPGSMALKTFLVNLRENIRDIQTMQVILDSINAQPKNDSLKKMALDDLKNINAHFVEYVKKFADSTQSVASALFAVNIINPAYETPYITSFYQNITKRFPSSKNARYFADRFLGSVEKLPPASPETGNPAPDFTANDVTGKPFTLSSLRGHYVLLDFWASWCEPCRAQVADIARAAQQYKSQNLEVVGVSLDSNSDKWKEAIKNDKMDWTQVSELKGWAGLISRNYSVEAIPRYFLLDPQGNIIGSDSSAAGIIATLGTQLKPSL